MRAVVVWLGLLAFVGLLGGIWLASYGKQVPDFLIGTVSACIGALGALLAKTSSDGPAPVQVMNEGGQEAIPVEVPPTTKKTLAGGGK